MIGRDCTAVDCFWTRFLQHQKPQLWHSQESRDTDSRRDVRRGGHYFLYAASRNHTYVDFTKESVKETVKKLRTC